MRQAQCSCGSVAQISGQPSGVVACHCLACQRRTGSPFGVGPYYPISRVHLTGEMKEFTRATESGGACRNYFCPNCGSTDKHPGKFGVSVGAFADRQFAPPDRSVWERSKHDWVTIDMASSHF